MRIRPWTLIPLLAIGMTGCHSASSDSKSTPDAQSTSETMPSSAPASAPASAPESGIATVPPSVSTAPPSTSPPAVSSTPPSASRPAKSFQLAGNEGLEYSGVQHGKPIDMELVMSSEPGKVTTGSQTTTLKESKDGNSVYTVDRSGGLASLGTEEWTVNAKGVFTSKSSMMTLGDDAMELPAHPKPGMKWKFHTKSEQATAKMDMEITCQVVGNEDVKTKGGTFKNALVVEQDGTGTVQGKKVRTESKNWYVKGLGLVKATLKNHLPDGTDQTLSIQETKS